MDSNSLCAGRNWHKGAKSHGYANRSKWTILWQSTAISIVITFLLELSIDVRVVESRRYNKALENDDYTVQDVFSTEVYMPDVTPKQDDDYLCTFSKLNGKDAYITGFEPHADMQRVHHMLVFGCSSLGTSSAQWQCSHHYLLCNGMTILYAWGRNAEPLRLPDGVGFKVGPEADINYVVLQVHYSRKLPESMFDRSGVSLKLTYTPQPNLAGIQLMASGKGIIPRYTARSIIDIACQIDRTINVFATRVHAHSLGRVIVGYKYNANTNEWTTIAKGNPQWPQAFYLTDKIHQVTPNDFLIARCVYNSTLRSVDTTIGGTAANEMCNLYLMYYVPNPELSTYLPQGYLLDDRLSDQGKSDQGLANGKCVTKSQETPLHPPIGSDDPLPVNLTMESTIGIDRTNDLVDRSSHGLESQPMDITQSLTYSLDQGFPIGENQFGQISGVDLDHDGNIIIFHRADRVWGGETFDMQGNYLLSQEHPIKANTIVCIDANNRNILWSWGKNFFFIPHGLSLDRTGQHIWVTDVALHQVFKFPTRPSSTQTSGMGVIKPLVTLGRRFEPGSDRDHFCQPTSVVEVGDYIFIADGYCNSRVLKYTISGHYIGQFGQSVGDNFLTTSNQGQPSFSIPHKIIYVDKYEMLCVADRENGRIICFDMDKATANSNRLTVPKTKLEISRDDFNNRVFSIDYSPAAGGLITAVSGPPLFGANEKHVRGFVFSASNGSLISTFVPPTTKTFGMAHDLAMTDTGNSVYVVEVSPNQLWRFSRPLQLIHADGMSSKSSQEAADSSATYLARQRLDQALLNFSDHSHHNGLYRFILFVFVALIVVILIKNRRRVRYDTASMFRPDFGPISSRFSAPLLRTLFDRRKRNEFDRIPMYESDPDDSDDNSDSDVEEFNINQATRRSKHQQVKKGPPTNDNGGPANGSVNLKVEVQT